MTITTPRRTTMPRRTIMPRRTTAQRITIARRTTMPLTSSTGPRMLQSGRSANATA